MPGRKRKYVQKRKPSMAFKKRRKKARLYRRSPYANQLLQQELKFHDDVQPDPIVSTTGAISSNPIIIAQGTGESDRVGRLVIMRKVTLKFTISLPTQTEDGGIGPGEVVRIMFIQDTQCNGAAAVPTDVLETAKFDSYRNLANIKRFKVLYDKFVVMNRMVVMEDALNAIGSPLRLYFRRKTLYMKTPIEYSGTTGALPEIRSNYFFFLYITKNGTGGITEQHSRYRYDG